MEQYDDSREHIQQLRNHILADVPTQDAHADLTEYVKILIDKARHLSRDELLHGKGINISSDLCIALAWNDYCSELCNDDGWLTEEIDPVLDEMGLYTSTLDADNDDFETWKKLFTTADKLTKNE